MRLTYRLMNVFTRGGDPLTGNPLCVFEDGRGVSESQMLALARQFNLSETTFILPSETAHARVRIYTPDYEMPFAGHPTLGTAEVVRSLMDTADEIKLEFKVGVVSVAAQNRRWEMRLKTPTVRTCAASKAEIASALGLHATDIPADSLWINAGAEQLLVPVNSIGAVRNANARFDLLIQVTRDGAHPQAYVFAESDPTTLVSRFFFTNKQSVVEDPATGSAAANLGGWYIANGASPLSKTIAQGDMIGRPSTIHLRTDADRNVYVAGDVIELGRGYLDL